MLYLKRVVLIYRLYQVITARLFHPTEINVKSQDKQDIFRNVPARRRRPDTLWAQAAFGSGPLQIDCDPLELYFTALESGLHSIFLRCVTVCVSARVCARASGKGGGLNA